MAVLYYAPSMVDSRHVYAREKYLTSMNNIIQWNCLTINLIEIILLIQTLLPIAFCPQVSQLKKSDHITYTPKLCGIQHLCRWGQKRYSWLSNPCSNKIQVCTECLLLCMSALSAIYWWNRKLELFHQCGNVVLFYYISCMKLSMTIVVVVVIV